MLQKVYNNMQGLRGNRMKQRQAEKLTNDHKIIWYGDDKLDKKDIVKIVNKYMRSGTLNLLNVYNDYYTDQNTALVDKVASRAERNVNPNNYVPSAYYSTLVDTMAGYMFFNVQYLSEDESYQETFNEVLDNNNVDILDMYSGIRSIAYNKSIELVYTTGDGIAAPDIKVTDLDPRQVIIIWDDKLESEMVCAIRVMTSPEDDYMYYVDVIYSDEWQYWKIESGDKIIERDEPRELFFTKVPVVEYNTELLSVEAPFHKLLPYINALDFILTGNSNDLDKLTDAMLIIGKLLQKDDKKNLDEIKLLEGFTKEDRAEFLTKNLDPTFREYSSKLIIQEIHKHGHVIDYYSPDTGLTGDVSAKALLTRMFDMAMFSNKIEMVYRVGAERRVELIGELLALMGTPPAKIEIDYNRMLPDDMIEKAAALNAVAFIADEEKYRILGLDPVEQAEKLAEQKENNIEMFSLETGGPDVEAVE